MNNISRIKSGIKYLLKHNFYSFRRGAIWPEGDYKRGMIKRVQKLYRYKYFVETGTYLGETPLKLKSLFEYLWTIELDKTLFEDAKSKLNNHQNIECMFGDSKDLLPSIVKKLECPAIFWLDGHYSCGKTASGEIKAPIIKEINAIGTSALNSHIIIIDDISDFSVAEGNSALSSVLLAIEEINPQYKFYFDYDILFALPFEPDHRSFWRKIAYPIVIR
jgi:hypothetical protein